MSGYIVDSYVDKAGIDYGIYSKKLLTAYCPLKNGLYNHLKAESELTKRFRSVVNTIKSGEMEEASGIKVLTENVWKCMLPFASDDMFSKIPIPKKMPMEIKKFITAKLSDDSTVKLKRTTLTKKPQKEEEEEEEEEDKEEEEEEEEDEEEEEQGRKTKKSSKHKKSRKSEEEIIENQKKDEMEDFF